MYCPKLQTGKEYSFVIPVVLRVLVVICKFDDSHRGLIGLSLLVAKVYYGEWM